MKILLIILITFIFLSGISLNLNAQVASSRNSGYAKTAVVPKKHKNYKYIILIDTKDILYGNKCATRLTHKYGFEYLPMPKSQLVTERESSIMFHNLFTNASITLRHGIFWKLILKKRIKECQIKLQDMNG